MLIDQGWSLDGFESHRLPATDVNGGDDAPGAAQSGADVRVRRP
jgi:hypothetical protein